jgi:hypothetical protein
LAAALGKLADTILSHFFLTSSKQSGSCFRVALPLFSFVTALKNLVINAVRSRSSALTSSPNRTSTSSLQMTSQAWW